MIPVMVLVRGKLVGWVFEGACLPFRQDGHWGVHQGA